MPSVVKRERIEAAWARCKDWLSVYDGAVHEAYFIDVTIKNSVEALSNLEQSSSSFRLAPNWSQEDGAEVLGIVEYHQLVELGDLLSASVDYMTESPGFELIARILIDPTVEGLLDANLIWWPNQVFPQGTEHHSRFCKLASHLLALQESFASPGLYIASENLEDPRQHGSHWVQM